MREVKAECLAFIILFAGATAAMSASLTVAELADLCMSPTMAEAVDKGRRLGWLRTGEARLEEWRRSFVAYNGSAVEVVGWQRGGQDEETLSFWIARGPNGHRACAYSAPNATGLLEALSDRFGSPAQREKLDFGTSAFWRSGAEEIRFTAVGSRALINISRGH